MNLKLTKLKVMERLTIYFTDARNNLHYTFKDLDSSMKERAKKGVLATEKQALEERLKGIKASIKSRKGLNIHYIINSNVTFRKMIKTLYESYHRTEKHIIRVENDDDYCDKFINGNLCMFLKDGTYITFGKDYLV